MNPYEQSPQNIQHKIWKIILFHLLRGYLKVCLDQHNIRHSSALYEYCIYLCIMCTFPFWNRPSNLQCVLYVFVQIPLFSLAYHKTKAWYHWCHWVMKRNGFSLQQKMILVQCLPDDYEEKIIWFHHFKTFYMFINCCYGNLN